MRKATYFTKSEVEFFSDFNPIFSKAQLKVINRKTPDSEVEVKTDKSGFTYKSVKAAYVKAFVMLVSGGNFSFEIKRREFVPSTKEVLVEGRLSMIVNGVQIIREQFGQHYLNIKTETKGNTTYSFASEIGNGYKAAASDAFKKCASEFGFFWDIYGQEHADQKKKEVPESNHSEKKKLERLDFFLQSAKDADEIERVYEKYLETGEETEASKTLFKSYYKLIMEK